MTTRPSFRPPRAAEFKAGDGGKTAVSMSRWVTTLAGRGDKGPWSEVTTATVAA